MSDAVSGATITRRLATYESTASTTLPHSFRRHVVLAQVYSVGVYRQGDVYVIVDDEQHTGLGRHLSEGHSRFVKFTRRGLLIPKLDDPGTPRDKTF